MDQHKNEYAVKLNLDVSGGIKIVRLAAVVRKTERDWPGFYLVSKNVLLV